MKENLRRSSVPAELGALLQRIALHGICDSKTGVVSGTERITGYVAKIHKDGELAGTVDVQEFVEMDSSEAASNGAGYHEGVFLSAIQSSNGVAMIPKLYSEVVIVRDPASNREFVSMVSHVDVIRLDSHEEVVVGVTERDKFDPDNENSPDIDELGVTGIAATTIYNKEGVRTSAVGGSGKSSSASLSIMGNGEVEATAADKSSLTLNSGEGTVESGSSKLKVTDSTVYVGSDSGTDDAVLGQELATILSDLVGLLSQMMTTTAMGPQPPANVLPQFMALRGKIQGFAASHSGFLSRSVQIRK